MRAVPRLCEFYPGICLTTEEKGRKNLSQSKKNLSQVKKNLSQSKKNLSQFKKNLSQVKKNLSQVKKNLSQSTVYILPKHPHITKPTHTHTYTHTLQNNTKPPQYKLKQTQCKIYPNETVTI